MTSAIESVLRRSGCRPPGSLHTTRRTESSDHMPHDRHPVRFQLVAIVVALTLAMTGLDAQMQARRIFITPTDDGFHTYITAAFIKKKVKAVVVKTRDDADFVLTAAEVTEEKVTTGRKLVNCLFAYCGGNEDKASTSVELVDRDGVVAWSYSVNKGRGKKNLQSMAEAIAKHIQDEFVSGSR